MIRTEWFFAGDDLTDAHCIRREVFIKEQNVPESVEMDEEDKNADHIVVYDGRRPVATGRIVRREGRFILGRIAVLKEERGKRYGDLVVRMLTRRAFELGAQKQYIHAQLSVKAFYEKIGYVAYGEEYLEVGIPHVNMVHEGDVRGNCG